MWGQTRGEAQARSGLLWRDGRREQPGRNRVSSVAAPVRQERSQLGNLDGACEEGKPGPHRRDARSPVRLACSRYRHCGWPRGVRGCRTTSPPSSHPAVRPKMLTVAATFGRCSQHHQCELCRLRRLPAAVNQPTASRTPALPPLTTGIGTRARVLHPGGMFGLVNVLAPEDHASAGARTQCRDL